MNIGIVGLGMMGRTHYEAYQNIPGANVVAVADRRPERAAGDLSGTGGNVLGYHQYPPHWIEILGKRIRRVHIKDFKKSVGTLAGFCDLLDGDVPFKESMAALRAIGYDKTIVAEMMPPDPTLLKRTRAAMDRIVKM